MSVEIFMQHALLYSLSSESQGASEMHQQDYALHNLNKLRQISNHLKRNSDAERNWRSEARMNKKPQLMSKKLEENLGIINNPSSLLDTTFNQGFLQMYL